MRRVPPSFLRVVYLVARLLVRRFVNRLSTQTFRRKPTVSSEGVRTGTPGKSRPRFLLVGFLAVMFTVNGVFIAGQLISRLASWASESASDRVYVSSTTFDRLERLLSVDRDEGELPGTRRRPLRRPKRLSSVDRDEDALRRKLEVVFNSETVSEHDERARREALDELVDTALTRGLEAFIRDDSSGFLVESPIWPTPEGRGHFLKALAVLMALLWIAMALMALTGAGQEFGKVEWAFEWLYTLPARTHALFFAKMLEYTLVQLFPWFTFFPIFLVLFFGAGFGAWSLLLALAVTLYQNALIACLRLFAETWLRLKLGFARLKNLQALISVFGIVFFYCVLYLSLARELPDWFQWLATQPWSRLAVLPSNLPLLFFDGSSLSLTVAVQLSALSLFFMLGVMLPARLVRGGLVRASGGYQGTRFSRFAPRKAFLKGVLGKEVRLLMRDRGFFVQTLVVPVLILGFQVVLNPDLFETGVSDFRHAAAIAFGVGAYVLMFGGASVLTVEGSALWLLYTFPVGLHSILRRKTLLWAIISVLYGLVVLVCLAYVGEELNVFMLETSAMALVGIFVYAFIAAGIAVMSVNPEDIQSGRVQRRTPPQLMLLYVVIGPLYGFGLYAPALWSRIALVVLFSLLALAIWQKVSERIPYLLDPTTLPPPSIGLSDGLIATLAFFVTHGGVQALLVALREHFGEAMIASSWDSYLATAVAGGLVVLVSLCTFWARKVPIANIGLRRVRECRVGTLKGLLLGTGLGLVAGLVAQGYRRLLETEEISYSDGLHRTDSIMLAVLAVVVVPIVQEFIFRGLVFNGLRRTLRAGGAAFGSATVFALVQTPLSAPPLFLLGFVAALALEWTGLLYSAIAAHAAYNLIDVALAMSGL